MYVTLQSAATLLNCLREGEHSSHPHATSIGRARKELADVMSEPDPDRRHERRIILLQHWRRRSHGIGKTAKTRAEKECWNRLHAYASRTLTLIQTPEYGAVHLRQFQYVVEYYSENTQKMS